MFFSILFQISKIFKISWPFIMVLLFLLFPFFFFFYFLFNHFKHTILWFLLDFFFSGWIIDILLAVYLDSMKMCLFVWFVILRRWSHLQNFFLFLVEVLYAVPFNSVAVRALGFSVVLKISQLGFPCHLDHVSPNIWL